MTKVFIDGGAGTTGLRLQKRLEKRADIELLKIDEALRKKPEEIRRLMSLSDFTFLCLPDEAAVEAAALAEGTGARLIDASTAHRCDDGWAYGFPELSAEHKSAVISSGRVAVPGCHAGGFISLAYPLVAAGVLSGDAALSCTSLTGYSGGGKKMIAEYESADRGSEYDSPNLYALGQTHKHLPEIVKHCGLSLAPTFLPVVGSFYSGMLVTVPLHRSMLKSGADAEKIREVFKEHYSGCRLVTVADEPASVLSANALAGRDDMRLYVSGNEDRIILSALFDNLGKGASGAAVQCFNLMCGLPETEGLNI